MQTGSQTHSSISHSAHKSPSSPWSSSPVSPASFSAGSGTSAAAVCGKSRADAVLSFPESRDQSTGSACPDRSTSATRWQRLPSLLFLLLCTVPHRVPPRSAASIRSTWRRVTRGASSKTSRSLSAGNQCSPGNRRSNSNGFLCSYIYI